MPNLPTNSSQPASPTISQSLGNWIKKNSLEIGQFKEFSQKLLAALSLAGQLALNQPTDAKLEQELEKVAQEEKNKTFAEIPQEEKAEIIAKMVAFANLPAGKLEQNDELYLEQQLTDLLGFEVTAELEEQRLNHTVGIMGAEQHLKRFPSDTLDQHDAYQEAGLANNRGAFGWFTQNGELTPQAVMQEKYYFTVQTMYLPNWNKDYPTLKPWYKFRKMVVINPNEGLAVVGVVADAGPALAVKKQFGGSPEVIREGKIWSPKSKGRVLLFFIDDPNDQVKLGVYQLTSSERILPKLAEISEAGSSAQLEGGQNDE